MLVSNTKDEEEEDTYSSEQCWKCDKHCCCKEQGDNQRRAFWVRLKDVVYFRKFTITKWLFCARGWQARVKIDLECESLGVVTLTGTEGCNDYIGIN